MFAWGWILAATAGATDPAALRPDRPVVETIEVRRAVVTVRIDARGSASPGACRELATDDLRATIAGKPTRVVAVDRVPSPRMHWLILDTSESTGDRGQRKLAKEEAARWVREVLVPGRDTAAVLTMDEDLRLLEASSEDPETLARAIESAPPGGQSLLTDALDEVLAQIAGDRREHVVILWTDGGEGLSLRPMPALRRRLGDAPNARIFPVAIQPDAGYGSRIPPQWLFELAEATGGRVSLSADRGWLEFLRGAIHLRWRVAVEVPSGVPDGTLPVLRSTRAACEAVIVPDGEHPGDRVEGRPPREWEREYRRQRHRADDAGCGLGDEGFSAIDGVAGCALDVVRDQGILYADAAEWKVEALTPARLALRRYYVPAGDPEDLPVEPWRILEALERHPVPLVRDGDDVPPPSLHPLLVNGRTFFMIQGAVARALWETQPAWRDAARRRLAADADREVSLLAEDLREQSPSLPAAEAIAAAETSPLGRSAREAVKRPTDADLRRAIGAWLGDVSARDLFLGWERAAIDRRLAGGDDGADFETRWSAMRPWFALPEHARTIVPLVPMRDPRRDVAGFWRVLVPRACWIAGRRAGARGDDPIPYDHVPPRPLAFWLFRSLPRVAPEAAARLAAGRWRVAELDYAPAGKLWKEDPTRPYSTADVMLVLESDGGRLELRARIDDGGANPRLAALEIR